MLELGRALVFYCSYQVRERVEREREWVLGKQEGVDENYDVFLEQEGELRLWSGVGVKGTCKVFIYLYFSMLLKKTKKDFIFQILINSYINF